MQRTLATIGTILFYVLIIGISLAIADDGSGGWDSMGRGGGAGDFGIVLFIAFVVGAHYILKAIDKDYIFTIIAVCAIYAVIAIISYKVFDYQMGWGWFLTIFVSAIFLDKQTNS